MILAPLLPRLAADVTKPGFSGREYRSTQGSGMSEPVMVANLLTINVSNLSVGNKKLIVRAS